MKKYWSDSELSDSWSLSAGEYNFVKSHPSQNRLGIAVLLKYLQIEGKFPKHLLGLPTVAIEYLAQQLNIHPLSVNKYKWTGRSFERHRQRVRLFLGYRVSVKQDNKIIEDWLKKEILPVDHNLPHLKEATIQWCKRNHIELPSEGRLERIIRSAFSNYETETFKIIFDCLSLETRQQIIYLLEFDSSTPEIPADEVQIGLNDLKADPGRTSLESVLKEIAKYKSIDRLKLPEDILFHIPDKILNKGLRKQKLRKRLLSQHC